MPPPLPEWSVIDYLPSLLEWFIGVRRHRLRFCSAFVCPSRFFLTEVMKFEDLKELGSESVVKAMQVHPDKNPNDPRLQKIFKQWDILSNDGVVQEMAHIANGRDTGNCVSLLRVNVMYVGFAQARTIIKKSSKKSC
ncbi:homeobox-leucine zipper protein HDG2 isoform X1 [Senna tora]|uniref:Homeobox-leucine zipper protein HDG2 isoform X1 n=1 Tax=Senna tora TaxID=362788 RepID=A0A834TSN8_9FABA|nr:homeobox-leucine zipper protein HDG2 isoform X1 [Senna tora]